MHVTYPLDIDTTSSSFDTFDIHPLVLFVVTPPPPPPKSCIPYCECACVAEYSYIAQSDVQQVDTFSAYDDTSR